MTDEIHKQLLQRVSQVQRDYPFFQLHGIPIGGRAAFFTVAETVVDVIQAVKAACDAQIPYVVVGSGAATVITSETFPGLVIQNKSRNIVFSVEHSQVVVDAGYPLQELITVAASKGLGGFTSAYLFGGTIGSTIIHNPKNGPQPFSSSVRAKIESV